MSKNLKETIDRMVEDSIRRILPNVLNEVLVRTIANSGVIREREERPAESEGEVVRRSQRPVAARRKAAPGLLANLLDPAAGSELYEPIRGREVMREAARPIAQRMSDLPPMLQEMARDIVMEDMGGESGSWDDDNGAIPSAGPGDDVGPLEIAASRAGLDFGRMARIAVTENKKSPHSKEDAQFEEQRIKRMRERLNGGKPIGD